MELPNDAEASLSSLQALIEGKGEHINLVPADTPLESNGQGVYGNDNSQLNNDTFIDTDISVASSVPDEITAENKDRVFELIETAKELAQLLNTPPTDEELSAADMAALEHSIQDLQRAFKEINAAGRTTKSKSKGKEKQQDQGAVEENPAGDKTSPVFDAAAFVALARESIKKTPGNIKTSELQNYIHCSLESSTSLEEVGNATHELWESCRSAKLLVLANQVVYGLWIKKAKLYYQNTIKPNRESVPEDQKTWKLFIEKHTGQSSRTADNYIRFFDFIREFPKFMYCTSSKVNMTKILDDRQAIGDYIRSSETESLFWCTEDEDWCWLKIKNPTGLE